MTIHLAGKMVTLVEDDQAPAITESIHVTVRTIIGCDCEVLNLVIATADQTYLFSEGGTQQVIPLIHQIDGRSDDECPTLYDLDNHLTDVAFACAGGEDDYAPSSGGFPSRECFSLK